MLFSSFVGFHPLVVNSLLTLHGSARSQNRLRRQCSGRRMDSLGRRHNLSLLFVLRHTRSAQQRIRSRFRSSGSQPASFLRKTVRFCQLVSFTTTLCFAYQRHRHLSPATTLIAQRTKFNRSALALVRCPLERDRLHRCSHPTNLRCHILDRRSHWFTWMSACRVVRYSISEWRVLVPASAGWFGLCYCAWHANAGSAGTLVEACIVQSRLVVSCMELLCVTL